MFLKKDWGLYLAIKEISSFKGFRKGFKTFSIKHGTFDKIFYYKRYFPYLFVPYLKVKPLMMSLCICISPHIKVIFPVTNLSHIL